MVCRVQDQRGSFIHQTPNRVLLDADLVVIVRKSRHHNKGMRASPHRFSPHVEGSHQHRHKDEDSQYRYNSDGHEHPNKDRGVVGSIPRAVARGERSTHPTSRREQSPEGWIEVERLFKRCKCEVQGDPVVSESLRESCVGDTYVPLSLVTEVTTCWVMLSLSERESISIRT